MVPYVALIPQTVMTQIKPGFGTNKIALSCIGNEIRVFINGTEFKFKNQVITDDTYKKGNIGVGAMSFTTSKYPVKVEFEKVSAELP